MAFPLLYPFFRMGMHCSAISNFTNSRHYEKDSINICKLPVGNCPYINNVLAQLLTLPLISKFYVNKNKRTKPWGHYNWQRIGGNGSDS